tara:strand:+ start:16 stop:1095 length:1080 start_codon:yes stop_codon:yes gene_type:complete
MINQENNIIINESLYLPQFEMEAENIINKSIILYGSRGSGKSVICKDILYKLKDSIPTAIVFNATESNNGLFSSLISKPFLYEKIELKVLDEVWKRQEMITVIYKKVNDVDNLIKIIKKLEIIKMIESMEKMDNKQSEIADNLELKIENDNEFLIEMNKLNDKFKEVKLLMLKKFIIEIKKKLKKNILNKELLNQEELDIIKFIDINPNLIIVFDDCAAELKRFNKTDTLRKLFYQSRHVFISFIITCQDEIDLDASLRKNANISIFCDSNCCIGFFERSSNAFSKKIKTTTKEISDIIYSNEYKNTKLIYNKDSDNKLMWYIAKLRDKFVFGSKYTNEFAKKIITDKEHDISLIIKKI